MLKTAKKLNLANQLIGFIESLCKISRHLLRKKERTSRHRITTTKKKPANCTQRLNKFN
jgi:hypothetical protein